MEKKKKHGKKSLIIGLIILIVGIITVCLAYYAIKDSAAKSTINAIGVILILVGILFLFISHKIAEQYCPECGEKYRRVRTFLGQNSTGVSSYQLRSDQAHGPGTVVKTGYQNHYHHMRDCENCGYHKEWDEKSNVGYYYEYPDGHVQDQRPRVKADYDKS